MFRATIRTDGTLQLGAEAEAAGYGPGVTVDVLRASSGALILRPAVEHDAIELRPIGGRLPRGRPRKALGS